MKLKVECYAGYRGDEEPRAFALGERRLDVREILDRWLAPDHRYFKVAASDGDTYILRHDNATGEWTLGAYRRGIE
ncbi:MAG: hypothetical protein LJE97_05335 [Betaproteobacteria bacterium]|jgi:hypothetical protein|nr:hypothetical protein [Betaproteobacteria bacterium]